MDTGMDTAMHAPHRTPSNRASRFVTTLLRCYQAFSARRPPVCRFHPSCSEYAIEAIEVFGIWRGARLAARRLTRCRPGGWFGLDPVPAPAPLDLQEQMI